ncbi:hypothetical protein OUZ56_021373 [Daphnia magna]|uniref:Uncharacterized protein n=1 Tax=Daphnia magna TaxID=35525 RepID=A0ABQ9ZH73_9CRUS|nr:hypothetical protein OUZ56_021373 [Daphnia magna]
MASSRKSYLKTIWCARKTRGVRASLLLYLSLHLPNFVFAIMALIFISFLSILFSRKHPVQPGTCASQVNPGGQGDTSEKLEVSNMGPGSAPVLENPGYSPIVAKNSPGSLFAKMVRLGWF